jgi:hypothetical protein
MLEKQSRTINLFRIMGKTGLLTIIAVCTVTASFVGKVWGDFSCHGNALFGETFISRIGGQGNFVLDLPYPFDDPSKLSVGTQVQIYPANACTEATGGAPCIDSRNQRWVIYSDGHISSYIRPDLVLDVRGVTANAISDSQLDNVRRNPIPVQVYTVNNPATFNQLWHIENGMIVSALNPQLVLDVAGNPPPDQAAQVKVNVYPAGSSQQPNQQWGIQCNYQLH